MNNFKLLSVLVMLISIFTFIAAFQGISSDQGPGEYSYRSIRGNDVLIYGKGIYQHMSADVAPQGIAQDYVTLFLAIPLLLISLFWTVTGSLRGRYLLAGVTAYFLVTYLFYLTMGMYNYLFLIYAVLLALSFFVLAITLLTFPSSSYSKYFTKEAPARLAGSFLIFNSSLIALLWLSIVVPPLLDGSLYPTSLEHYTTLIVQGLDLGLLLPLAFVSGWLLFRRINIGYLLGPVYLIFLALMMTALTAKIIAMGLLGQNIIPVVFIIPVILMITLIIDIQLLKSIKQA